MSLTTRRPTIRPLSARPCYERDRTVNRDGDADRLPLHIAGPIIIALSLSLWGGIGFIVSAVL
jgi:hypothetical protein